MTLPTRPAVAKALRSTANPTVDTVKRRKKVDPPEVVLRKHVEKILFFAKSIVPRHSLLARSLSATLDRGDWRGMEDDELVAAWESEVHRLRYLFACDPDSWEDEDTAVFRDGCAKSFGIESRDVTRLLLEFHDLPGPRRLAILVLMERSAAFSYIVEQVDNAPPGMAVENADESYRMLMKRVWGT